MPFKKGHSGNPKGRAVGWRAENSITSILKEKVDPGRAAAKMLELIEQGYFPALKYYYDRIDGMPRQSVELTGKQDKPVPLLILRAGNATSSSTG